MHQLHENHRTPVATPAIGFEMTLGSFVLKIADSRGEIESAVRLRSEVFRADFGVRISRADPLWDYDEIDDRAKHLIVLDRESGRTVGTYRLVLSEGSDGFYSQSEFDLADFLARPGLKLELSRACVDANFRGGAIMVLLWKGLTEVIRRTGASVLFGCSSLKTEDPARVQSLMESLEATDCLTHEYAIRALPQFRLECNDSQAGLSAGTERDDEPLLSPLLRMYLKAGAKLAPEPAHDRAFHCVDLLTILDIGLMNEAIARKYGLR